MIYLTYVPNILAHRLLEKSIYKNPHTTTPLLIKFNHEPVLTKINVYCLPLFLLVIADWFLNYFCCLFYKE